MNGGRVPQEPVWTSDEYEQLDRARERGIAHDSVIRGRNAAFAKVLANVSHQQC